MSVPNIKAETFTVANQLVISVKSAQLKYEQAKGEKLKKERKRKLAS